MELSHSTYLPLAEGQEVATSSEILAWPSSRWPDRVAIHDGDSAWTYAELNRLANRFANSVLAMKELEDGPVAIMGRNSIEYIIAHFGTSRTGRYSANFPTRCTVDELAHALRLTQPCVVFADPAIIELINQACSGFERPVPVIPMRDRPGSDLWGLVDSARDEDPGVAIDPDGAGTVIFTGGTTGRPKAVLTTQRARAVSAMAAIEDFRIRDDYIAGYSVPFTHTAGLCSWFQPAVLAGCEGVVVPKWDPVEFTRLVERHGINVIFAVPSQLATLLDHPDFDPARLESLQLIAFGGAPLARALIERAEAAMPWLECARAFGSTETGHLAAQRRSDREFVFDGFNNPGGRLEIELFSAPGEPAGVGETGEIATRGAHLMTCYLGDEESTRQYFRQDDTDGEWGWMGDLAVRHDGYFSIAGRSKHMIISGGLNIYPAELEDILTAHPQVLDCVVFGIEDDTWGELPAAAVVRGSGSLAEEELLEFVAAGVARHKRLRRIWFVDEIARTSAGKARVDEVRAACLDT